MKRIGYHSRGGNRRNGMGGMRGIARSKRYELKWKPEKDSVIGRVWALFFENMGLEVKIGKRYGNSELMGGYRSMSNVLKVLRWEYGMDIRRMKGNDERCCYMLCGMYVDGWKGCNGYIDYMVKEEWEREVKLGVGYGLRGERR